MNQYKVERTSNSVMSNKKVKSAIGAKRGSNAPTPSSDVKLYEKGCKKSHNNSM